MLTTTTTTSSSVQLGAWREEGPGQVQGGSSPGFIPREEIPQETTRSEERPARGLHRELPGRPGDLPDQDAGQTSPNPRLVYYLKQKLYELIFASIVFVRLCL